MAHDTIETSAADAKVVDSNPGTFIKTRTSSPKTFIQNGLTNAFEDPHRIPVEDQHLAKITRYCIADKLNLFGLEYLNLNDRQVTNSGGLTLVNASEIHYKGTYVCNKTTLIVMVNIMMNDGY